VTDDVRVDVRRSGRRFEAEATLDLAADVRTVWETITDYGALPRFMPGIRACRVIERRTLANAHEHLVVEQEGEFRFLLFAQPMTVLLDIVHQPLRLAEAKAGRFDLGIVQAPRDRRLRGPVRAGADRRAPRPAAGATALYGPDRLARAAAGQALTRAPAAACPAVSRGRRVLQGS